MLVPDAKTCKYCGAKKVLNAFQKHPRSAFGRTNKCKTCASLHEAARYEANHENIRELANARYASNKGAARDVVYAWRKTNIHKHKAANKKWRAKNNASHNAYERARYANNEGVKARAAAKCRGYQISKKNATPKWAEHDAIKRVYFETRALSKLFGKS